MTTIEAPKTNGKKTSTKVDEVPLGTPDAPSLVISRIETRTILVPIIGTKPLIVHNFSAKSKKQMLDAQQGVKNPKVNRDPESDYAASLYRMSPTAEAPEKERFGFPVLAFKDATVSGARYYKNVQMTQLRASLFFSGETTEMDVQELVEIHGEHRMREDVVRLSGPSRSADLRFRAEFPEWTATLKIRFVRNLIGEESLLALIDAGGMGTGVGEWRPAKKGESGTFTIDTSREVVIVGE